VVFRDDFQEVLASGWTWQNEDPSHWNLAEVPGSLRIVLQDGGVNWGNPAKNVLLRQAPAGKFEIATLVHFTPNSNFQIAGLVIYQDDANVLHFGRAFCDRPDVCTGNGIYFDSAVSGEASPQNFPTNVANPSTAYLKVRREGATYTGYYSEDGTNWMVVGQHSNPLNPLRVGLIAAQAIEAETTADFDYFTITTWP
jgi:beta-xylosidase